MKIEHPNAPHLTRADLEHLDTLKALVEGAIADGVVSPDEYAQIKAAIWVDQNPTPAELDLVQDLIWRKIQAGELILEWN